VLPLLPLLLIPEGAEARLREGGHRGDFRARLSEGEQLGMVTNIRTGHGPMVQIDAPTKTHWLHHADVGLAGVWFRVAPAVNAMWWMHSHLVGTSVPRAAFDEAVPNVPSGNHLVMTFAPDVSETYPDLSIPTLVGWQVTAEGAAPMRIEIFRSDFGRARLEPGWPSGTLSAATAMVVGVGSIGAAAAIDLATYGVGRLIVVDPGRLGVHNLIRHVSDVDAVGRPKVTALEAQLNKLRPETIVEAVTADVINDADLIRGLLTRTDVVLCAADGVASRRVVSHLARRAKIDAVLACVLEDGAVGEVIRLRPWPGHGCLLCRRRHLEEAGVFDPEPALDAGYGNGTLHRPMTAVGGDLHLVANLAAQATVTTVLERRGVAGHKLAGEHAVIGLRSGQALPAPFDATGVGDVRWSEATAPFPDCPTCST
jgi:hypothetical protein